MTSKPDVLVDFVSGRLSDADLARVVRAGDAETIRALEDLAPMRAALKDPDVRSECVVTFLRDQPGAGGIDVAARELREMSELLAGAVASGGERGEDPYVGEVRTLLRDLFPSECSVAGAAAVEQIVQGDAEFGSAGEGDYLDTSDSISVIADTVRLIDQLLELRQDLLLMRAAGIDTAELKSVEATRLNQLETGRIPPGRRRRIIERVLVEPG